MDEQIGGGDGEGSVWGYMSLAPGAPYRLKNLVGDAEYTKWMATLPTEDMFGLSLWDAAMQELMRLTGSYEGEK